VDCVEEHLRSIQLYSFNNQLPKEARSERPTAKTYRQRISDSGVARIMEMSKLYMNS
jgi:hypothetical protein